MFTHRYPLTASENAIKAEPTPPTWLLRRILCNGGLSVLVALALLCQTASAEIVFVDLDDLPVEDGLVLSNGPFVAEFLHIPCGELPPGIWGPPCIAASCGLFGSDSGNADRLTAGEIIGEGLNYVDQTQLIGYGDGDPSDGVKVTPIANDWFDRSGDPVRGYMSWGGTSERGGDPHYGWIELTVEYDPATGVSEAVINGYAYEDRPNMALLSGEIVLIHGDMDLDEDLDFDDIRPFVLGLNDPAEYEKQFGIPPAVKGTGSQG